MVSQAYMLEKSPPPSALEWFIDEQVVPAMIQAAGAIEGVLEVVAQRTRQQPATALSLAAGFGVLLFVITWRPRRRT